MALEKTRQREIRRDRLQGPVHGPVPGTGTATTVETPKAPAAPTTGLDVEDAHKKQLGQRTDKAPVAVGTGASNARSVLMQHVQHARADGELTVDQRKFLRTAFKELAKDSARLDEHTSLRGLAAEHGCVAAFDAILRAHGDKLLPELKERAQVFAGPAALRELLVVADAMGKGPEVRAHLSEQLALARAWAKTPGELDDVHGLAAQLGVALPSSESPPARTYEASAKHHAGAVQGGFISPAPTHGQAVLNKSVQVKPESPRRVGVDREAHEYVVFDQTTAGVFHGHTRTWDQLHTDMQDALVEQGVVNSHGKIL